MPDADPILALLQYDHWCTDQLAGKMESLAPGELQREFPIGWRTLHKTLFHIVYVAEHWTDRSRAEPLGIAWEGGEPDLTVHSVAALRGRYRNAAGQMVENLQALNGVAEGDRDAVWLIRRNHLIHITTHGMHHRGQMIFMLTQLGVKDVIEGGDFGGWANEGLKRLVEPGVLRRYV